MRVQIEGSSSESLGSRHISLDQPYAYRSLDKVSGSLNHAHLQADRIKVHLTGTSYIAQQRFVDHQYRKVEKSWEFLKLTKEIHLTPETSTTTFAFRLPEALLETQCPLRNHFHLLLPPTVGCERDDGLDDLSPKDSTNARIEYNIVSEYFKDGHLLQSMNKPFRVAPRHFATPGSINPPPGYDETLVIESDVQRAIGGKTGSLKIVLQQPPALLSSLEEHQLTTKVPLTVEYHSTSQGPPKLLSIAVKLRATTHSRTEHLLEGDDDISRSTELRLNKVTFSKHASPVWRPLRPAVWVTDLDLPVTLCPKGYVAIPEFNSCLVDRSYTLLLKFDLSPQSGLPLSETRLSFRVWIMADEYYGIPSEARPGMPVKHIPRYQIPRDLELEPRGSLPTYEDTVLTNLAPSTHVPPIVVASTSTASAPFSLQGREPDYFVTRARGQNRNNNNNNNNNTDVHGGAIEGVEPEIEPEDEGSRVPSWQAKEEERLNRRDTDPREQDGAQ